MPQEDVASVEAAVNEYLKDKINATLKITRLESQQYTKQLSTMIAAGEYFDLAWASQGVLDYTSNARNGAWYDMTDSIATYMPKTAEEIGEDILDNAKVDGKLYAIPTLKEMADSRGWTYRSDIAAKYGIDMSQYTSLESDEDVEKLEEALEVIAPEMTPEALAIVNEQGVVYNDRDGDLVTSIVNGKDCVFASRDENGGCICLIEKAYREGRTPWRKPISCYLYPVRLRKVGDFTAVNFHKWDVCSSAFVKGRRKGIRAYEFLKEPLIERFGKEWYDELLVVAEELKKQNML
jgi:hypothetical protein